MAKLTTSSKCGGEFANNVFNIIIFSFYGQDVSLLFESMTRNTIYYNVFIKLCWCFVSSLDIINLPFIK